MFNVQMKRQECNGRQDDVDNERYGCKYCDQSLLLASYAVAHEYSKYEPHFFLLLFGLSHCLPKGRPPFFSF